MKLPKEEYKQAVECLKRYNYNCITIINIRADSMGIGATSYDGMPKTQNFNSDRVVNSVIEMQENVALQKAIKECKIVSQALQLVSNDSKYIFEEMYRKGRSKWDIIYDGMSERTFGRRKMNLIYAVSNELKKMA